jgi:hypothetical protein
MDIDQRMEHGFRVDQAVKSFDGAIEEYSITQFLAFVNDW